MPTLEIPRGKTWDMNMTQVESPVAIPEFQLESEGISRHRVATNTAVGTGPRPRPGAPLMVPWKQPGVNRSSGFLT